MIVAATPGIAAWLKSAGNGAKLDVLANGQRSDLARVVDVLERLERARNEQGAGIDAIHRRLDQLQAPPAASGNTSGPSPPGT
jgi:hypothetical protein